jgi:chromate transporter
MIGFAYAAPALSAGWGGGWLHGLKIAAAAVVAQALAAMARTLACGPITGGMAVGAALGAAFAPGAASQIGALLAGAAFGMAFLSASAAPAETTTIVTSGRKPALAALALFAALLVGLPLAAAATGNPTVALADVFYRAGSLVFGGGHVVLPLLESEVVGARWLDRDTFLAGYGAVQAAPGPLFNFAAFVGASQGFAPGGWRGGLAALAAIFLPSLLLVLGVLPFWDRLKARRGARGAVAGANAVVVGLLAAALWSPVLTGTVRGVGDAALIVAAFLLLTVTRLPPWAVVLGFAGAVGLAAP